MTKTKRQRRSEPNSEDEVIIPLEKQSLEDDSREREYESYLISQTRENKERKRKSKIEKKFAVSLLNQAEGWEDHELARLFLLISDTFNFSNKKKMKFLKQTHICNPEFLACLTDLGISLSPGDVLSLVQSQSHNYEGLIRTLNQMLEYNLVNTSDLEFIHQLHHHVIDEGYTPKQTIGVIRTLCSHADTMALCGQILNAFFEDTSSVIACQQIAEVLSHDYVFDLGGTMSDFLSSFHEISHELEDSLSKIFRLDDFGKVIRAPESDEDEDGNLVGFIVNDDISNDDSEEESEYRVAHEVFSTSSSESLSGHEDDSDSDDEDESGCESYCDESEDQNNEELEESEPEMIVQKSSRSKQKKESSKNRPSQSTRSEKSSHVMKSIKLKSKTSVFSDTRKYGSSHSRDRLEEEEIEIIEAKNEMDDTISRYGKVTEIESSDDERREQHQSYIPKLKKARSSKKKSHSGKRIVLHDSSSENELEE